MHTTEFSSFYNYMKSKGLHSLFYQYNNDISSKQYEIPVNISAPYIKEDDHVLDWSCGNGHFFSLGTRKRKLLGLPFTMQYLTT